MTTQATTRKAETRRGERSPLLLALALGTILATLVALLAGTAREAQATFPGTNARIALDSNRTTGVGHIPRERSFDVEAKGTEQP